MAARQSLKYGVAAVGIAVVIILAALLINPALPSQKGSQSHASSTLQFTHGNFLVMLTDPPTVPSGTTQLNLTFTGVSIHVIFPNGTTAWIPVKASGTVNLLALVNVTQTVGSISVPVNSTADMVQLTISSVKAEVHGVVYPVTTLSNQLLITIQNHKAIDQTLSGAILDLSPTLIQVPATNSTGASVYYYVLAPSATAIVKTNLSQDHSELETNVNLEQTDENELNNAQHEASGNLTIVSATLSVSGNTTQLSVTFKNMGKTNATIFGLTLHGNFSAASYPPVTCPSTTSTTSTTSTKSSSTTTTSTSKHGHEGGNEAENEDNSDNGDHGENACDRPDRSIDHPHTIPFRINGTSLMPLFGDHEDSGIGTVSSLALKPGQTSTLTFAGVVQLGADHEDGHSGTIIAKSISGDTYTIRLMGEGFQTFQVTAA